MLKWAPRFLTCLAFAACLPLGASPLDVTAIPSTQSILEGTDTTVDFQVLNNTGMTLVLDYALGIINGPANAEDQIAFAGVTFPSGLLAGQTGNFTYTVTSAGDNPADCCDNGLNHISFYLEMSPFNGNPFFSVITNNKSNASLFYTQGGSTGTLNNTTLTTLKNCYNTPGSYPNPCNVGANLLYSNGIQGQPFPTVAAVNVYDLPEPATWTLAGAALVFLGLSRRVSHARL